MREHTPTDEYDPLAKLYRAERALIAADGRGEPVGDQLRDVKNSIREIIERRQAQSSPQQSR